MVVQILNGIVDLGEQELILKKELEGTFNKALVILYFDDPLYKIY